MIATRSFVITSVVRKLLAWTSPSSSPIVIRSPTRTGRSNNRMKPETMSEAIYCSPNPMDSAVKSTAIDVKSVLNCLVLREGQVSDKAGNRIAKSRINVAAFLKPAMQK